MSQRRQVLIRVAIAALLVALVGLLGLIGQLTPAPERMRPTARPRPTLPVMTRVSAPIPFPTMSPLEVGSRSVSAPEPPVLLSGPQSAVVNVVCQGECVTGGGANWLTSDLLVKWTHPDPAAADYYEVWTTIDRAYCDAATCPDYERAGETTGLDLVVDDAPPGFNPIGGTAGASIMSRIVVAHVRACNAGGCSAPSNEIGAVNYSLNQGNSFLPPLP